VQHSIGDHALLADGRTAALLDPDGNVAWMCWPRYDSPPLLMSLLDERSGGVFSVRPARPDAHVESRRYHPATLVLETVWRSGRSRIVIDDALVFGAAPTVARRVRGEGDDADVEVRFDTAHDAGAAGVALHCPGERSDNGAVRVHRFHAEATPTLVTLSSTDAEPCAPEAIDGTVAAWRRRAPAPQTVRIAELARHSTDESTLRRLLTTSACVLQGLRWQDGGIVAAPTTSLPQWPGATRNWDYRYCWVRDGALAARAMLRLGLVDDSVGLASFLGHVTLRDDPPALVRVDGGEPPAERALDHLGGYRSSRPVRFGNAASKQVQVDIAGEVTRLACELDAVHALPAVLAASCSRVAAWAAAHWREPDHGIWEIRGAPRRYTHSRVMAWTALRDAADLAEAGRIDGDANAWRRGADAIRAALLSGSGDALQLTAGGGGADAALACVPAVGLLAGDDPVVTATLDLIAGELDRGGLVDRCRPEQEAFPDPCGPFVFPTFWLASALEQNGRSGQRHFSAALRARGDLGLFGEVADPGSLSPLGNYPQVQSHAAFVLAATES